MKTTQQIIRDLDETDKESLLCGGSFDISPCNSFTEDNRMFIGHDYGAAVYVQAVQVDVSDKITAEDVHEVGEEISIEESFFIKALMPVFEKYFEPQEPVNKYRFTRAFSGEGRYITRFEMHALEPNFYTMDMARKIIAELEIMGKSENADAKWFGKLAEYMEKIVNVAPQGSFISVTN